MHHTLLLRCRQALRLQCAATERDGLRVGTTVIKRYMNSLLLMLFLRSTSPYSFMASPLGDGRKHRLARLVNPWLKDCVSDGFAFFFLLEP